MNAIKARKCFVPRSPSDWVAKVFLTCDNVLAVQFKRGQKVRKILPHGPGAYLGSGGAPSACCLYPGTQGALAERLYDLAQTWAYAGEWVHAFLYKKFGYRLVQPPAQCGGCHTSCSLSLSPAAPTLGQVVAISCTVTNSDGSATKGDAPKGTVAFIVDGASIGTAALPDNEPDTANAATATIDWTATSGTHTIVATYNPADADFAATTCSTTLTVGGGGISTTCCPSNLIPATLYLTISNVSGCACMAGTYALIYAGNGQVWASNALNMCGASNFVIQLVCSGTNFMLYGGPFGTTYLTYTCAPSMSASNVSVSDSGFCTGTVNVTVTA